MLAWKAYIHGLYELLGCQSSDSLVTCQLIHLCPAAWTLVGIVFVCAHLTGKVTILALHNVPVSWNLQTNNALESLLNLPLELGLCFLDGLLAGFFANPFYLRFGQIRTLSRCHCDNFS